MFLATQLAESDTDNVRNSGFGAYAFRVNDNVIL